MARRTPPDPFFYFDMERASEKPRALEESKLTFVRRLSTRDGALLRGLLNRCWDRYTEYPAKRREMAGRLERGDDRVQAGVITELLVSEILDCLYAPYRSRAPIRSREAGLSGSRITKATP